MRLLRVSCEPQYLTGCPVPIRATPMRLTAALRTHLLAHSLLCSSRTRRESETASPSRCRRHAFLYIGGSTNAALRPAYKAGQITAALPSRGRSALARALTARPICRVAFRQPPARASRSSLPPALARALTARRSGRDKGACECPETCALRPAPGVRSRSRARGKKHHRTAPGFRSR